MEFTQSELKYAEKYEVAEKLYDQILEADTQNKEALRGKADCRIMLEPIIPVQHLAIPALYLYFLESMIIN